MLKKLLKYDLSSIFKFIIIFYSLSVIFALSARLALRFDNSLALEIIGEIFRGASISMMFSILINNLMRLWVRFRANFYGDESYLTHTLPITRRTQYLSKFITAVITMFVSVCVIALTLFIAYYSKENFEFIKAFLLPISDTVNIPFGVLVAVFIILIFLEFLCILQCGFTGIIFGHKMLSGKIGLSVVFGFITSTIVQMIILLTVFFSGIFNKDILNIFVTDGPVNFTVLKTVIIICIVMYTVMCTAVCVFNIKILSKGVDVE